jgi:copper(I)-binding protein
MLNKIIFILGALLSSNCLAQENAMLNSVSEIKVLKGNIKITEPFTALGIATLEIQNTSNDDILIEKITSPQVRHAGTYTEYKNDFGATQVKPIKNVYIKANSTTKFSKDSIFVMLTGLDRKYEVDEKIELNFKLKDKKDYKAFVTVITSYK